MKDKENPAPFVNPFETASTYASDMQLFKTLGLKTFTNIPINIKHFVGEVIFENASVVKVYVVPTPAQFWIFEVHTAESHKLSTASCGSGTLTDFWNCISLMADNMIDIENTEFIK